MEVDGTSRMDLFIRPLGPWNRPTRCGSIEYLPQQRSLCTASSRGMLIDYTCCMNLMSPMSCVHAQLRSTRCAGHVACDRTTRYLFSTVSCMFAFDRGRSSTPPCTHTENYTCKQVHEGNISVMHGAKKHHCSVPTVNDRVAIFGSARDAHARTGRSWILRTPLDIIAPRDATTT